MLRLAFVASLLSLAACAGQESVDSGWVVGAESDGKADSWDDLVIETEVLTVTLPREIVRDNDTFLLSGSVNKKIASGKAFVRSRANTTPRAFGTFTRTDESSFEIGMSTNEMMSLARGETLFVEMKMTGDSKYYVVEIETQTRVARYDGSANPSLVVVPTWVDGGISYRFSVQDTGDYSLADNSLWIAEHLVAAKASEGPRASFDIPEDAFMMAVGADEKFEMINADGQGWFVPLVERAMVSRGLRATAINLPEICYKRTCLEALPAGTRDTSSCGEAIEIMACQKDMGARIDDESIASAMAATPLDAAQAEALVGADRAASFLSAFDAARAQRASSLENAWVFDAAAGRAVVAEDLAHQWAAALANPFPYITARPTRISATASAGEVAADALLKYLPTEDLVHSEFTTTLTQMTQEDSAMHVEVFRRMRAGLALDEDSDEVDTSGDVVTFTGSWFGAYIEVTVSKDEEPFVHFEID